MEKHFKRLYNLNILSIVLQVIYSVYLLRNVIFALYHETENKVIASIFIPIAALLIISLFVTSNFAIKRGLYDRYKQKWAAILFIVFVCCSDVLIITAFLTFHPLGKLMFILVNIIAFVHARRYIFRNARHNEMMF